MRTFFLGAGLTLCSVGCFTFISFDDAGSGGSGAGATTTSTATSSTATSSTASTSVGAGGEGGGVVCPAPNDGCTQEPCFLAGAPAPIGDVEATGCDVAFSADVPANLSKVCSLPNGKGFPFGTLPDSHCADAQGSGGVVSPSGSGAVFFSPMLAPGEVPALVRCANDATNLICQDWPVDAPQSVAFNGLLVQGGRLFGIQKGPWQILSFDLETGESTLGPDVPADSHTIRIRGQQALVSVYPSPGCLIATPLASLLSNGTPLACGNTVVAGTYLGAGLASGGRIFGRVFDGNNTRLVENGAIDQNAGVQLGSAPGVATDTQHVYYFASKQLLRRALQGGMPQSNGATCSAPGEIALTPGHVFYACGSELYRVSKTSFL